MKLKKVGVGLIGLGFAIMIGAILPQSVHASKSNIDLSGLKSDYKCNDSSREYHFYGSTTSHNITVDCNGKTVYIYLKNASIDMLNESNDKKSEKKPAINIKSGTNAVIYLEGENVLHGGNNTKLVNRDGYAGIQVAEGASVTILGNGKADIKGGGNDHGAAGIGAEYDKNCGMITIGDGYNCPVITAVGGDGGAGIGGSEDASCKKGIYIYNGNITATGKNGGAGIGAGDGVATGSGGNVDTILISGGTITATGSSGAAGIGGSDSGTGGGSGDASNITIGGGNITAIGGSEAAGIGGGRDALVSNITITGGTITATGGKYGAGIGGGNHVGSGDGGDVKNLNIAGGTIIATGGESAAGIGGGDQSIVTGLMIVEEGAKSLNITATGGKWGAGIGNGNSGVDSNDIDKIYINLNGGKIIATGGSQGAGIGGGNSVAKEIFIYGKGTIDATGYDESCAIGSGEKEDGGNITIEGRSGGRALIINAYAAATKGNDNDAAAIGSADSKSGTVTIKNAEVYVDCVYGCYGSGIGIGKNQSLAAHSGGDIIIENCYIKDKNAADRNASSIGAGTSSKMNNIIIKNSEVYGGSIGGTDNNNQMFDFKCIGDITIDGSTIEATAGNGNRAAIGSSVYSGVGTITITNSTVTANAVSGAGIGSGGYTSNSGVEVFRWLGCSAGDIYIKGSTVTANGGDGGAGIGGGWGTSVGSVFIEDSDVEANGGERGYNDAQGGAGIGGGYCESLPYISVKNSTVKATGGRFAAGIGSGGNSSSATTMWNTSCGTVELEGSNITATGGEGGAGIGTGYGAQFYSHSKINIISCEVTAVGGKYAAGIGAGANGWAGAGGEACDITITGDSKVTATGGEGGAGIGGGRDGGCDTVEISLSETTYLGGDKWLYYVKATGGKGAAGIGSGGVEASKDDTFRNDGQDTDKVIIKGGYVYAVGGDNNFGAGAGIGGGARGGNLNGFEVSGGYVVGQAGTAFESKFKADDIGTGGDDGRLSSDNNFKITGGTVIGNLSSDPEEIIVDGGSVSDKLNNAKRSDGTKVYRTRMELKTPYYKISNLATNVSEYGTSDIISDGNAIVYLYLPLSGTDNSKADFEKYHYYGTTGTSGEEWIKMDLALSFVGPDKEPIVGDSVIYTLNDADLKCDILFTKEGDSVEIDTLTDTKTTSPGAQVKVNCLDFGDYYIKATTSNMTDNMYHNTTAVCKGKVTKSKGVITSVECASKVYDTQPVAMPTIETNSDGAVTYKFYKNDVYLGDGVRPVEAGEYYVIASVAGTNNYSAVDSEKIYFEIIKRNVSLEMTAVESGDSATVTVEVFGLYSNVGKVTLAVQGGNTFELDIVKENDRYFARHTFDTVVGASDYTVTASYNETKNYKAINQITKNFNKSLANRTITVNDITAVYGDSSAPTSFTVTQSLGSAGVCTYEVIYDMDSLNNALTKTIQVNSTTGEITYLNAGIAYVKITMHDPGSYYDDAVAIAKVTVTRKPITVSSFAYLADDISKTPVTSVKYGEMDTLLFGLKYGGSLTAPADFAALGSLEAIAPKKTLGVNDDPEIFIAEITDEIELGDVTYDMFISRNYLITYDYGTIDIIPAELRITVDATVSEYGKEPDYTCYFGRVDGSHDLMPWDLPEVIVDDLVLAGGQQYESLMPGVYDEVITAELLSNPNYVVTVKTGDLRIDKGQVDLDVSVKTKIYDGTPSALVTVATPDVPDSVSSGIVKEVGAVSVEYYSINDDGDVTELTEAPVNVGNYYVKTTVAETECYKSKENISYFRILKARYDIDTPRLDDIYIKEGLTLEAQVLPEGWEWIEPTKELSVGPAYGFARYTPEKPENYYAVIRRINFNVLEVNVDTGDAGDTDVNVGYMGKFMVILALNVLVGSVIAAVFLLRKKK